jgi:hypothetical protein
LSKPRSPGGGGGGSPFGLFWQAYPKTRETWKGGARAEWIQGALDAEVAEIVACVEKNADSAEWTKEKRRYCPTPLNFLLGREWRKKSKRIPAKPAPTKPNESTNGKTEDPKPWTREQIEELQEFKKRMGLR